MTQTINFHNYTFPFQTDKEFSKRVAYLSMEFALDQSLKIYSGGLGFLAGSHMRSAYALKQNVIGIGILWKYGYYDQERSSDNKMYVLFQQKAYNFLQETNIKFKVTVNDHEVWVKALYLEPETFQTAPMFFLSTDLAENDYLSQTITYKLYDSVVDTKIAQSIILGIGAGKLMDALNYVPDIYHLNEAHGLPVAFHLFSKYKDKEAVRKRIVFTTHTPVEAGNEKHDYTKLIDLSYFQSLTDAEVKELTGFDSGIFEHTLAALRVSKIANGVSKIHGEVANKMWGKYEGIPEIFSITNSQNKTYWADTELEKAAQSKDTGALILRKTALKKQLFDYVANQTGKRFDPNIFTVVWARRFAEYKRPQLIMDDTNRFEEIFSDGKYPVQIIWAGKPYPKDELAITLFDELVDFCSEYPNIAILTGYELGLSKLLKQGSDLWLNNPRIPNEASGTSGMTAMMNASVNLSTYDGWIPEFIKEGINGFVVPPVDYENLSDAEEDKTDRNNILDKIENTILPLYYEKPNQWYEMVLKGMHDITPMFDSDRMAQEYYEKMYRS